MFSQYGKLGLCERAVLVNAKGISTTTGDIKGLERPDQIEPVFFRGEHVDLAALVGCVRDGRRGQDARSHNIPIPRNPQSVIKCLTKSQP